MYMQMFTCMNIHVHVHSSTPVLLSQIHVQCVLHYYKHHCVCGCDQHEYAFTCFKHQILSISNFGIIIVSQTRLKEMFGILHSYIPYMYMYIYLHWQIQSGRGFVETHPQISRSCPKMTKKKTQTNRRLNKHVYKICS